MASSGSRNAVAERSRGRTRSEEVGPAALKLHDEPVDPLERGLKAHEWEKVRLEDIDLDDRTFSYRLSAKLVDVRLSLEAEGQLEPIDVTGRPPHRVIDGHRRAAAAQELGWTAIKAFVHRGMADEEAFRLSFAKNAVRKNLSPVEKAQAMLLALKRGIEREELARTYSISEKQVQRYLTIAEFPDELKVVLDGRTVTMAHALLLSDFKVKDPEAWAKRIETERLDAATLKAVLTKEVGRRKRPGRPTRCVRIERNAIRFYPVRLARTSTPAERDRVVTILESTIKVIRSW